MPAVPLIVWISRKTRSRVARSLGLRSSSTSAPSSVSTAS